MTAPEPAETTKLDELRDHLHAALVQTMAACGWPAERAHRLPPRQPVAPTGWVDTVRLSPERQDGVRTVTATYPVAVVVDGADAAQVAMLDRLMAHGWAALERIKLPSGHAVRVTGAGPEFLDVGGVETRALVFTVSLTLQVRTLCSGSVTASDAPVSP